jgi:DnaJ-class molecular chaperone
VSVAKITRVEKSRKAGQCEKCKADLPVGSAYLWFVVGFRSKYKHVRCLEAACAPKQSERESSQIASVYAAQEDFEDALDGLTTADDIVDAMQPVAEAIREVAEAYREAAINPNTGDIFNPALDERADTLESAADEVESASIDDETTDCEECAGTGEIECETCAGDGAVEDEAGEQSDCGDCDGTGHIDCEAEDCDGGQVPDLDAMRQAARDIIDNVDLG